MTDPQRLCYRGEVVASRGKSQRVAGKEKWEEISSTSGTKMDLPLTHRRTMEKREKGSLQHLKFLCSFSVTSLGFGGSYVCIQNEMAILIEKLC